MNFSQKPTERGRGGTKPPLWTEVKQIRQKQRFLPKNTAFGPIFLYEICSQTILNIFLFRVASLSYILDHLHSVVYLFFKINYFFYQET